MARNRIIYASQSVIANGDFLYRVQTLGSTTSFTSTDLFELGQQDIIDVVDDVPTVAITLDTNDWGSVRTAAALANVKTDAWDLNATASGADLVSVNGVTNTNYYWGISLSHYGVTGSEFDLWAPVQAEASLGTANNIVDQTLFMGRCFANGITLNYSVGGQATENYTAETDNKMWLLNDGRFISQEEWDITGATTTFDLGITDTTQEVALLSDRTRAFLYTDPATGKRAIKVYDASTGDTLYFPVLVGAATATTAGYVVATNVVTMATGFTCAAGDRVYIRYASEAYATAAGDSTRQKANYFTVATDANVDGEHSNLGGVRQGQVEIYLVDPDNSLDYELSLRIQSVNISATLNREALSELGHLKPYDRPVTFPIEITTTVETTAGDLETFAKFCGKGDDFADDSAIDISIDHLLTKDNLVLVVMIYDQTDVEAGGTGADRLALRADLAAKPFFNAGVRGNYDNPIDPDAPDREYPLKTVIVPDLKATNEAYNLSVGSNATQSFTFRSTNKLFFVKGFVPFTDILLEPGLQKYDF
jgi:hypothetical protein